MAAVAKLQPFVRPELTVGSGRLPVVGLSCRCLYGAVRQQCAGHLPFERQARANGGFSILPTGSTDPSPPVKSIRLGRHVSDASSRL